MDNFESLNIDVEKTHPIGCEYVEKTHPIDVEKTHPQVELVLSISF